MKLALALMMASVASAQELTPPPLIPAPDGRAPEEPAYGETRRAEPEHQEPIASSPEAYPEVTKRAEPSSRTGRIVGELLLGGIAELGVGIIGALAGCAFDRSSSSFGCLGGALVGGLIGMQVGTTLGVWGVGWLLDGDGSIGAVIGGQLVGTLLGIAAAAVLQGSSLGAVLFFALPVVGAIVGFEATSNASRREATVAPALGMDAGGRPSVGLQGAF